MRFWRETGKELVRGSIKSLEEAARQIIGISSILEGLYFNAIAFSKLRAHLTLPGKILYLAPIVLLLVSLAFALGVFFPRLKKLDLGSSTGIESIYQNSLSFKLWMVRLASLFLVSGVFIMLLAVVHYLAK